MEIERKFLIKTLPDNLKDYPNDHLMQAYISTEPVIRVRKKNDDYILTLKSAGLLARQEVEMPLSEPSFLHLLAKKDGLEIEKTRYKIPDSSGYLIELDVFEGAYKGFCMAEVEFPDMKSAETYLPPSWFGQEVTMDSRFHNSTLSARTPAQVREFLDALQKM
ncbi:MAG: CYTH domain-containing protein [Eubacterium sp.]|nr:CYTH domain-containing protein [Eubacterium sp.]MDD7210325.1 CYTH domain-containing protein [Lachnospiraceae bacterium]MDY5496879.1 CYTH domain-containing protein [Anaerobutyricum sp.]